MTSGLLRREFRREPAVLQGFEHGCNTLGAHGGDDAFNLGAVIFGAESGGGIEAEREHMLRILPRIGRPDHAAQRMTGEMRLVDAKFGAQCFEVLDQIIERIGWCRSWRLAVATQIIGDHPEMRLEMGNEPVPRMARSTNAVNEKERRALALDREG